jgi:hypothetical protein
MQLGAPSGRTGKRDRRVDQGRVTAQRFPLLLWVAARYRRHDVARTAAPVVTEMAHAQSRNASSILADERRVVSRQVLTSEPDFATKLSPIRKVTSLVRASQAPLYPVILPEAEGEHGRPRAMRAQAHSGTRSEASAHIPGRDRLSNRSLPRRRSARRYNARFRKEVYAPD